jgi:hypothetical protein
VFTVAVQSRITQLTSNALSLLVNPSTTNTVIPSSSATMSNDNLGPTLKVTNGGILLPANQPDMTEEEKDA